jgi:hypothetical protein
VVQQLTVSTSEKARVAAEIIDRLKTVLSPGKAGLWMLNACPTLGLNCSPLQAPKDGREAEVRAAATALIDERNGRVAA